MIRILLLLVIAAALGIFWRLRAPLVQQVRQRFGTVVLLAGLLAMLTLVVSTSVVWVEADETGHLKKIYGGGPLQRGRLIATNGENGPQANVLTPGFHFSPFITVLNRIEMRPVVEVPEGSYAFLVAKDGLPLRAGQAFADAFAAEDASRMIADAAYYLTEGRGQKGPQTSILTPGKYRLNHYLWDVLIDQTTSVTEIRKGQVGVIRSNVWSHVDFGTLTAPRPDTPEPKQQHDVDQGDLSAPIVAVGAVGIWEDALPPGRYYINRSAYQITTVETRVQTWVYKGGYTSRSIALTLETNGQVTQTHSQIQIPVPVDAADQAVFCKVEGWDVPLELRVLVQVTPENAPYVVASVGDLAQVEDRILTPGIRSIARNVVGGGMITFEEDGHVVSRRTRVLDLIENRSVLEEMVEAQIQPEGLKAGVAIKEVRFGEPDIPPELLVARKREQLAGQMRRAFEEEQKAQMARIDTEQARAKADQQPRLVEAQIEVQRAEQLKLALQYEGEGQRKKLEAIATGQRAQADVLGTDKVVQLRQYELALQTFADLLKDETSGAILATAITNAHRFVPETVITVGEDADGGLAGPLAVFGQLLRQSAADAEPPATR